MWVIQREGFLGRPRKTGGCGSRQIIWWGFGRCQGDCCERMGNFEEGTRAAGVRWGGNGGTRWSQGNRVLTLNTLNQPKSPENPDDSRERCKGHCLASANWSLSAISGFPPARERRVGAERRVDELPGFMTRLPWGWSTGGWEVGYSMMGFGRGPLGRSGKFEI